MLQTDLQDGQLFADWSETVFVMKVIVATPSV